MLVPRIVTTQRGYDRTQFMADVCAGARVILSDVHAQPMVAIRRSALGDELSDEDVVGNIDDALNLARVHLGLAPAERPDFAVPTVAREVRRHHPRPPA